MDKYQEALDNLYRRSTDTHFYIPMGEDKLWKNTLQELVDKVNGGGLMNSGTSEVRHLMRIFSGYVTDSWHNQPIINWDNELILVPKLNISFRLDNVNSELELKCKVLEWCSRHAHKTQFYSEIKYVYKDYDEYEIKNYYGIKMNKAIYTFVLNAINKFLGTNFNLDEMEEIYVYLGNGINRVKAIKFIESNYDMNVLHSEVTDNE